MRVRLPLGAGDQVDERLAAPGFEELLEPDDRLRFERGRLRFRLALLLGPLLLLLTYGAPAVPVALLSAITILLTSAAIWLLLVRLPELLVRYQLWLRVLDIALIGLVLHYAALLALRSDIAGIEYFDALYLLSVFSATATHGRTGAYVASAAATGAVLANRLLLAADDARSFDLGQSFTVIFYAALYAICGSMVAFLMRTSGAVVERRERAWRSEMGERNKELERTAAQLAATNKELEAFAYSVSHDLRAPLRTIDGFSRVVVERYAGQLDAQAQDYLGRVRAASQRMGQLIDDLLALSRLTRVELRSETVNLTALANEIAAALREAHPERAVRFDIEVGMVDYADPRLLRVALDNLIGNAWKFTAKQPKARIEVGRCEVDGHSVYFVRDNGAGFDMAYAGKLFGAFQRLHTVAEFEGTGVGLATVQRIIHRHGGRVWAEGVPGDGATFYFTL